MKEVLHFLELKDIQNVVKPKGSFNLDIILSKLGR